MLFVLPRIRNDLRGAVSSEPPLSENRHLAGERAHAHAHIRTYGGCVRGSRNERVRRHKIGSFDAAELTDRLRVPAGNCERGPLPPPPLLAPVRSSPPIVPAERPRRFVISASHALVESGVSGVYGITTP